MKSTTVGCNDAEALQSFKLVTPSSANWYYAFTCCTLIDSDPIVPPPGALTCARYSTKDVPEVAAASPVFASGLPTCRGASALQSFRYVNSEPEDNAFSHPSLMVQW